jgi:ABC-type transport system involved in multi-copper enzyme maturation permease subunit
MNVFSDLGLAFWRLLPANPILVRVVTAGGKRQRHLYARIAYLAILLVVLILFGTRRDVSLADLAKGSTQTFMWVSMVQLFLMAFIAPVFTAGAITQEKDSNTYSILLTTPLSNAQIVLGSLLSRLYFVWVLLLSGLPIFCITMIYGGVTTAEVFESFALAACTGLVTGALAITISVLKVGTRRTIFAFFVGIAVYLLAIGALGYTNWGQVPEAPFGPINERMSWLAPIHPYLALLVVTGQTPAPAPADVFHYGWPGRWLLAYPQYGYILITTLMSAGLIVVSLIFVRRGTREGEITWLNRLTDFFAPRALGERRRKPRRVWRNPIAWREAATRASAGGRSATRWLFLVAGIAVGVFLLWAVLSGWRGLSPKAAPLWLTALIWIELAVILLVVTNTAASTLTREKESQTMELLLTTPLTSNYIVWGMLQGLISFALPFIAVPAVTLLLFVVADLLVRPIGSMGIPLESVLLVPVLMVAFTSVAAMVGLQFSLTSRKTIQAVMYATGIVLLVSGVTWGCAAGLQSTSAVMAGVVLPFFPFPAVQTAIDYARLPGLDPATAGDASLVAQVRVIRLVTSLISIGIYAVITYSLYRHMVRSFDMTVRKQST